MILVTFDKAKVLRLDDHARALNQSANTFQDRYLQQRKRAGEATEARVAREKQLARIMRRDGDAPDPELDRLRAVEAAELAEVSRLAEQRDRVTARWRNAAALIQRFRDTLHELGAPPVPELERP